MTVAAYRDRASGRYPILLDEVRRLAGALFGDEAPAEVLDELGLTPVLAVEPPAFDPAVQFLTEAAPVQTGGVWQQSWVVNELPSKPGPEEVTRRQAKIALSRANLLAKADEAIASMEGQVGEEARIEWADAAVFRRDSPLILGTGSALGLSADAIDELFRTASLI